MTKRTLLRSSIGAALGYSLLATPALQAKPIRIDDGLAIGASGAWTQLDGVTFDTQVSLGLNLGFFGGTADSFSVNSSGALSLFGGATQLGSITPGVAGDFASAFIFDSTIANPLQPVDGQAITDGFRATWTLSNGFESQLALFSVANGDSFIEFNYWDGFDLEAGLDVSGVINPIIGLISNTAGPQFNLATYLAGNQAGCLSTFGAYNDATPPNATEPTQGTGCTAYFVDGTFSSTTLPPSFQVANGGTAEDFNPVANYRYLVRYSASGTPPPPPPDQVPEPSVLSLLLAGLAMMALSWRRRLRARA